ncbi:MAG TPA: hypothetical protein VGO86_14010 [Candidatus Dormibacteraeota bacterium]|jgi:hypothetical protein
MRIAIAAAAMSGSMLVGGVIGATAFGAITASAAASPSPSGSGTGQSGAATAPNNGKFTPNEDATHEAGESAAREAQENAGQRPTVP